ncbi:MAG: flagellar export chaperone FliS [Oscillospiraceae bacterium]|jgi:flagellar protein FliS|nr:flagellar export chaperone FliS [Oscillospiraceae bacterium]
MTSHANTHTTATAYRERNVMTASPGELTLMLYDGCLKNVKLMRMNIEKGDVEKVHESAMKAQAILGELMRSLNLQYEVSQELIPLYDFMIGELTAANISKTPEKTDAVLEILTDLRDAWQQAVRIHRQHVMGTGNSI